jgi:uncharacterized protein YprB with RNaseH-like and TPR domain
VKIKSYLDIETSYYGEITVVGIYRHPYDLVQIVLPEIDADAVLEALYGTEEILTYWGHRFDLPVIKRMLGLDLRQAFESTDLADACHRCGLYGGLKCVEKELGIPRVTGGVTGWDAMRLWHEWTLGREESLKRLLKYNEEDVVNLYLLERELESRGEGGAR